MDPWRTPDITNSQYTNFDILKFSPKQKASSRSSGELTHTNPYIYSPEPQDDAFVLD